MRALKASLRTRRLPRNSIRSMTAGCCGGGFCGSADAKFGFSFVTTSPEIKSNEEEIKKACADDEPSEWAASCVAGVLASAICRQIAPRARPSTGKIPNGGQNLLKAAVENFKA